MRRGEVWAYTGLLGRRGQSDKRLIVSADLVNESEEVVTCYALPVLDSDPTRPTFTGGSPDGGGTAERDG